jgi:hypothetical protein
VIETTTALLGKDSELQLLDRTEADRVLREQGFSLAGMVNAEGVVNLAEHIAAKAALETGTGELAERVLSKLVQ